MSVIEKMSIIGIRSFGPDERQRQMVEFFKPLTLILGPNGSGKTTIIECLRYMATGEMPPNSDRGSSFVHDPKISGETEVRGQVKLQLKDVLNKKMIATRTMVVTQKQKKIQMKTLDGTLTRISANGDKVSLSSKCAEIDREMITALGVSKPILTNVIFCHQEDSNWPLSEGKTLKQKFDDIFAATRYIKALDEIRKIRLQKKNDIKVHKTQVESLKENRRKADEFADTLGKTKIRLSACKDSVANCEKKLKPIMDKLEEISGKEHEISKLQSEIESSNIVMEKLVRDEKNMEKQIKSLFDGTQDELKLEMSNFNEVIIQKKNHLEKVKRKYCDLENEQKLLQKKYSKMQEEYGKLKVEHQHHLDRIDKKKAKLAALSDEFGLGDFSKELDESNDASPQMENIFSSFKQKLSQNYQELEDLKRQFEEEENKVQANIDKIRVKKAKKEQEKNNSVEKIKKNKEILQSIDFELSQVDSLASRHDDLKEDLKEAEQQLEILEKSVDVKALRVKILEYQTRKKDLEIKLNNLNQEMSHLQKESKIRAEIELNTKEKTNKEDAMNKILNKHKDTIIHLVGNVPEKNFHDTVKALLNNLNREINQKSSEMENQKSKYTSLETSKKHKEETLKEKEDLLVSYKNQIYKVCGSQNFDDGFNKLEKEIKDLQDEQALQSGTLCLFDQYVAKLNSRKACCPLCKRAFETDTEAEKLKQKLQEKLRQVPTTLREKETLITEKQSRLNSMLELKPLKRNVALLSEKEIPNLKKEITTFSDNLKLLKNEMSDLEDVLDSKQCDAKTANDMLSELSILDLNCRDIARLERRLSMLTCQIASNDASRTIEVVSDEQTATQRNLNTVRDNIESLQTRISDHNEQVQRLKGQINDFRQEQVEISGRLQKKTSLEEQLTKLTAENLEYTASIKKIDKELSMIEQDMKESVSEKKKIISQKDEELEKIRKKISSDEKEKDYIERLSIDINRYIESNKEKLLATHENNMTALNSSIKNTVSELSSCINEKDTLNELITSQQMKFRDLEDNLKLIEIHKDIINLKSKCEKLKEKLGNFNVRTFLKEKRNLMDQEKQLRKEQNEHEGRFSELVKQISHLEAQLEDKIYKDANKKYDDMLITLRTTELLCDDLNKYYIALDNAVMKYHQLKMNEINKIIRDLWMQTYAGNDIDYIEIRSNEDSESCGIEKTKRIYNYKVIMMKNGTQVDMRGRCSAGQKVLASLIIRLALAETFCLNCGILALDEPTTNLDRENICSLARALAEIVKSRSEQRNFQLIIITHDEDFIELLGRSETVDYFYKVSKNNEGFSRISKCSVLDIEKN